MKITKTTTLTALVATLITTVTVAAYYPSHYVERAYYSDASKAQYVGESTQFCSGSYYSTGTVTAYYSELRISCNRNNDF